MSSPPLLSSLELVCAYSQRGQLLLSRSRFGTRNTQSAFLNFDLSAPDSDLARQELASALSSQLISAYFADAYSRLPLVDFRKFSEAFELAGRRADQLPPATSVLCNGK